MKNKISKAKYVIIVSILIWNACEYHSNKENVIAAKQNILDTGKQEISIDTIVKTDTVAKTLVLTKPDSLNKDTSVTKQPKSAVILQNTNTLALVNFAKTLLKTPYSYGGKDPKIGFDNAGFISYVFNHFGYTLPTTAASFNKIGKIISLTDAAEGDLILFSKTDSIKKVASYVGIIISAKGAPIEFIYATSGKVKGVTISSLNSYYQKRLVGIRSVMN